MINFFKTFAAFFALTAIFASTSFAGGTPPPNSVDCARQYRNCLKYCNQLEAQAKATKAQCESSARAQYPNGGAAYNAAIKACRDNYNAAMRNVAQCRATCKTQYDNCVGGGYGEQVP